MWSKKIFYESNFNFLGGDGKDGEKGRDAVPSEINGDNDFYESTCKGIFNNRKSCRLYYRYGKSGQKGGNAGFGGYGGIGGYGGMFYQSLVIFNSTNINSFTRRISFGKTGNAGIPGFGGQFGDRAQRVANVFGLFICELFNPASKCQSVVPNFKRGEIGILDPKGMLKEHEKQIAHQKKKSLLSVLNIMKTNKDTNCLV